MGCARSLLEDWAPLDVLLWLLAVVLAAGAAARQLVAPPRGTAAHPPLPCCALLSLRRCSWVRPQCCPMAPCCLVWARPLWRSWHMRSACQVRLRVWAGAGSNDPLLLLLLLPGCAAWQAVEAAVSSLHEHLHEPRLSSTMPAAQRSSCAPPLHHPPHPPCPMPAVLVCCESYKFHERVQLDAITHNEVMDQEQLAKVGRDEGRWWREKRQ